MRINSIIIIIIIIITVIIIIDVDVQVPADPSLHLGWEEQHHHLPPAHGASGWLPWRGGPEETGRLSLSMSLFLSHPLSRLSKCHGRATVKVFCDFAQNHEIFMHFFIDSFACFFSHFMMTFSIFFLSRIFLRKVLKKTLKNLLKKMEILNVWLSQVDTAEDWAASQR